VGSLFVTFAFCNSVGRLEKYYQTTTRAMDNDTTGSRPISKTTTTLFQNYEDIPKSFSASRFDVDSTFPFLLSCTISLKPPP